MTPRSSLAMAVLLFAASARAQSITPDPTAEAREHFQAGLLRAQQGDLSAALGEFEKAYAIRPHFSVLYNIGQARSTLARPVQAVAAFEQYLADGGSQIVESRRREVEALIAANRSRIGRLRVISSGKGLRVWLDGAELPSQALAAPIPVAIGQHSIFCAGPEAAPEAHAVSVTNAEVTETRCSMRAANVSRLPSQLAINCAVPDVDVDVGGVVQAKTPLAAPLLVPTGPLVVRFSRAGYANVAKSVEARADRLATVSCDQRPLATLPPMLAANLTVFAKPPDANVLVDGQPFLSSTLPAGTHQLRLERDGFVSRDFAISLQAGQATNYAAELRPTAASAERARSSKATRRGAGWIFGGAGAAALAAGVSLYLWNSGRYDDWRAQQSPAGPSANPALAASVQRGDDAALGLSLLGVGFAATSAWLFLAPE
jgi:hypothetical protein